MRSPFYSTYAPPENGRWIFSSRNAFPSKRKACLAFYDRLLNPSAMIHFFSVSFCHFLGIETCEWWSVFLLSLGDLNDGVQMFRSQLLVIHETHELIFDQNCRFTKIVNINYNLNLKKKKRKKMLKNRSKLFDKNFPPIVNSLRKKFFSKLQK